MRRRLAGAAIVLIAIAAAALPMPESLVEQWYSRRLFPAIQRPLTAATNTVPFALLDLAIGAFVVYGLIAFVRRWRAEGLIRAIFTGARRALLYAAFVYLLFLVLWGLNYRRVPIEQKLEYDETRVTPEAARQLGEAAVQEANALHAAAHRLLPGGGDLRDAFASAQRRLGVERHATPGVPKRSLLELYFGIAAIDGMTDPFFLEIILNTDLVAVERPFVLAHEWGHLAGFADESEANLVAWLTCLEGDDLARYSGWLAIYGHAAGVLPAADRRKLFEGLGEGPRRDLDAIRARLARSAPAVRNAARQTYDKYLKANRIREGIANYDLVVRLILAAGAENGWAPRVRLP